MCFGGGSKPQVVSTGTQQVTDKSWETLEPYIKNVLESSRSRFEDQLEEGYQAFPGGYEGRYEGPSIEELTAREGILQQGLSGIAGTGMASARPYYEAGLSALGSSMDQFGPQQAQQYMNPYQQAVVDIAKREAVRQAQPVFRNIGDRAESTGAFGGSRQAIAEAEANRNLQQQLGDIQTRGMQSAFEQGRSAFEAQKAREAAGAQRMFAQAPAAYRQGLAEMAAIEGVGRSRRGDEQAKKDFLYEQFEAEKMFPSSVYTEHLGHVRGFPYQPSMYKTTTESQPKAGLGQNLLGLAGAGASIFGGMGGFSKGGFGSIFAEGGQVGGLASLASGGQVQGGGFETHQNNIHPSVRALNNPFIKQSALQRGALDEKVEVDILTQKIDAGKASPQERARRDHLVNKRNQMDQIGGVDSTVKSIDEVEAIQAGGIGEVDTFGAGEAKKGQLAGLTQRGATTGEVDTFDKAGGLGSLVGKSGDDKLAGKKVQPVTIGEVSDALRPNLNALKELRDFTQEGDKQAKRLRALAAKQLDVEGRIAQEKEGIDSAYSHLEDYHKNFGIDLTKFTNKQLADNKVFRSEREAAINKRAAEKLAKITAMGKEAKETGEKNAMQNLFLNMLLPMSLQGGLDPRGFMAGALQGGKDNMKAFVDRYSEIKDKFATGKEKRDRDSMEIRDKQIADIFDMKDKFNARKQQLEAQQFKLGKENDRLIATTGKSKETEKNAANQSALAKEAEGLQTKIDALNLTQDVLKTKMDISQNNIKAISTLMDAYGIGDSTKTSGKAFKATFDIIRDRIKDKYNYMIDDATGTVMINGKPLSANQADAKAMQRELSEVLKVGTSVLQGGGTQYQNQVNALQAMLNSLQGGSTRIKFNKQGQQVP